MSKRTFKILFSVLAAGIIALAGMNIALDNEKTWDECYAMENVNVNWEQTYFPGSWNGV